MPWRVNPVTGEPPTGEPDAGDPPVRFGGRGGYAVPTPIHVRGTRLRRFFTLLNLVSNHICDFIKNIPFVYQYLRSRPTKITQNRSSQVVVLTQQLYDFFTKR
jgi:hypothetical protein